MKFIICLAIVSCLAIGQVTAGGSEIVAAVRTQIGVPYSWGGGGWSGKSKGIQQGAHTIGFDCSGLAQYGVYHGTHKKIARTAAAQYHDPQCKHVPYAQHQPGDLVFFEKGSDIHHVAIISAADKMIEAPHTGANVHETTVRVAERMAHVARCF